MSFTRDGPFINPSRARLNNVNLGKSGRFVFGKDDNALLLFNGAVAYCSLVEPTTVNGANIRCISVYPFRQDFFQWKNFLASVVQKGDFITYTDNDVVSFLTRKENFVEESSNGKTSVEPFSSPKKAGKFFEEEDEGPSKKKGSFTVTKIPNALSYNDRGTC